VSTKTITIRITPEDKHRLMVLAQEEHRSVTSYVLDVLRQRWQAFELRVGRDRARSRVTFRRHRP
jgi:predicted DNA-binding protein